MADGFLRDKEIEVVFRQEYYPALVDITLKLQDVGYAYEATFSPAFLEQHFHLSLRHYARVDFDRIFVKYVLENYQALVKEKTKKDVVACVFRTPQKGFVIRVKPARRCC
jgi:hypothetical protein